MDSLQLREAIRAKYAWPGGYEIFGITTDGGTLCCDCMKAEYYQIAWERRHAVNGGWNVNAIDCAANCDGPLYCDHCGHVIVEGDE